MTAGLLGLFGTAATAEGDVLGLHALLGEALGSHPLLQARQSGIEAAESDVDEARWQFWATPSISVDRSGRALLPGSDRNTAVLSVRQPIWTAGKLTADLAGARALLSVAEAQKEEARRDLALEVIQAYADHYTARARYSAYQESVTVHQVLLAQVERRAVEGLSAQSDVQLAQSRLTALLADRSYAEAQAAAAVQRLRSLVGHPLTPALTVPVIVDLGVADSAALLEQALAQDPTMARLQAESRQTQAQAQSTAAARWPQVYAGVTQRRGDLTGTNTQLVVGLQATLGAGLSSSAALRAAQQRSEAKRAELAARERAVGERVADDVLMLHSTRQREGAYRDAAATAREVCASWRRQFIAGKKAWQDVMNAERDVAQTEVQLADASGSLLALEWRLALQTRGVDALLQLTPSQARNQP